MSTTNGKIPRSPEEITPEWLTSTLRDAGVISGARVTSVETESIGAGAGLFGQLARLRLAYDREEPGAPASLIAKLPTTHAGNREIGNLFQFYERETRFYDDIAPMMRIRVPQCHVRIMDVPGDEYLLLLEDLGAATPPPRGGGAPPPRAGPPGRGGGPPKPRRPRWVPFGNPPPPPAERVEFR